MVNHYHNTVITEYDFLFQNWDMTISVHRNRHYLNNKPSLIKCHLYIHATSTSGLHCHKIAQKQAPLITQFSVYGVIHVNTNLIYKKGDLGLIKQGHYWKFNICHK